jgi:catecholate siderophore receptor
MFRASAAILLATTSLIATPALAAEAEAAASSEAAEATDIVVVGQREEYGVKSTSTATKTNTDIKDIPQALTVISESQIKDQQLRSIADVIYFVPGATPGTGESNRDTVVLRGNSSTADFFINGIRDDVQYFRDFYNVDRIEVLKGPNAMIFGRGGGGGIVNRVTKRSSLGEYRQLTSSLDSYGGVRFTGDFDQPLGEGIGLRVNGMYENGDSFRHHVDLKRYGINPTVGIQAGPDTRIDLSYEYFHDRRTADRGVPSDARDGLPALGDPNEPIDGFDKVFFGDPDDSFAKADVHLASFAVEHQLAEGLTIRNRTLYGHYDKFYQNIYPSAAVTGTTVTLGAYNSRNDRQNLISQTDLIWENRLGGIDQTLLFGFELGHQSSRNFRQTGAFAPGANIAPLTDPTVDRDVTFSNLASDANNKTKATIAAIYVQDQIRISPMFEVVAGLRFDSFKLKVDDLADQWGPATEFTRKDELWSPRLGLIFKPAANLSLYASYSRSYLPQSGDQFGGLTATTEALKPERFDNYEIGAKWEPITGLLATAAIYRLDRTNTRAIDPETLQTVLTGAQRSKGIELGLERSISDRWQVSAGYAWQKAEITETTTAAPAGRNVPMVPRHSFSAWTRYDFTKQIGAGLGVIARSKSYASISNLVRLPAYARVDAAAFYQITDNIEAQLNLENLFGADYFPNTNGDNNIAPGAPRNIKATVRFGF